MQQNNSFSRTAWNEAKAGAYYTDCCHVRDIKNFLLFPEGHVDVLEPSCGDCSAVNTLICGENASVWGVELNDETYKTVKESKAIEKCVCADFLDGVRIKFKGNRKFPLCFSNPPYMGDFDEESGFERLEDKFLKAINNQLSIGSVLVWVVPEKVFKADKHLRFILNSYEIRYLYKFRKEEYEKYHQVVAVLVKKERVTTPSEEIIAFQKKIWEIPELPEKPVIPEAEKVVIQESDPEELQFFESKSFDFLSVQEQIVKNEERMLDDTKRLHQKYLFEKPFKNSSLKNPLVTLCDGHIAQAITCGEGQGLTGTPGVDQHLQRGICEIAEVQEAEMDEENKSGKVRVQSFAKMRMTIIHPSGKIQKLL